MLARDSCPSLYRAVYMKTQSGNCLGKNLRCPIKHSFLTTFIRPRILLSLGAAIIIGLGSTTSGCKVGVNEVVKDSEAVVFDKPEDETGKKIVAAEPAKLEASQKQPVSVSKELIRVEKPTSPPKPQESKSETLQKRSEPPSPLPPRNLKVVGSGTGANKAEKQPKPVNITDFDRVKEAALDMAKNMATIKKIKICHVKSADEWWVTLFDDIGPMIDLKQYVWDPDSETLTPFLVLKKIAKSRLDHYLTLKEQDKTCQTMDPPPRPPKKTEEEAKDQQQK
jgi:hypothetical protein